MRMEMEIVWRQEHGTWVERKSEDNEDGIAESIFGIVVSNA